MIRRATDFFISLRTALWLLCALVVMLLAGAFIMPVSEEFQSIRSVPLFEWMVERQLSVTWWLWGALGLLAFLAANTLFCSIESLFKKRTVAKWLLIISPQVIHAGFLFILLAHLLSAISGFKGMAVAQEGSLLILPDETVLQIRRIHLTVDPNGYLRDWEVDVGYLAEGKTIREDRILPNSPSFRGGTGVYVKDLRAYPYKAVLLEVSREPGAIWALIGGVFFAAGTVALIALKMKRQGGQSA